MKYTRLEIYKGITSSKLRVLIGFFIVIPIIAVISGSIISRLFIKTEVQTLSSQNQDKPLIAVNIKSKLDYKIAFLQAGAFITKSNAETLKNAVKKEDIDPIVIEDGDIYRVIIQISDKNDNISQSKDKLQGLGYNCLINEFNFSTIESSENEEIEKTNNLIIASVSIIETSLKLIEDFSKKDLNNLEMLKKQLINLNNNYTELVKLNSLPQLNLFKNNIDSYTNAYINSYSNDDINECRKNLGQMILSLNNYYKELVQRYIK